MSQNKEDAARLIQRLGRLEKAISEVLPSSSAQHQWELELAQYVSPFEYAQTRLIWVVPSGNWTRFRTG